MNDKTYILLEYLYDQTEPIKLGERDVPDYVRTEFHFYGQNPNSMLAKISEMVGSGLITYNSGKVEITKPGKAAFEKARNEKKGSEEISKLQFEALELNVEDLRNKFFDYPETKRKVNRNEVILWIGIALTVISIIISLIKK